MMTRAFISIFCITLQIGGSWAGKAPVLLWGVKSALKPSLMTIRQEEFADLMAPLVINNAVVAFVEPNLTTEDLMCRNIATKQSCFTYLKNITSRSYYASVESPIEALKAVVRKIERSTVGNRSVHHSFSCEHGMLTIVYFNQSKAERDEVMELHDRVVANIVREFECPVFYLYTTSATSDTSGTSVRRVLRQTPTGPVPLQHSLFVFYCKTLISKDSNGESEIKIDSIDVKKTDSTLEVSLNQVTLTVLIDRNYHSIQEVQLNGVRYQSPDIHTPTQLSYFCGKLVLTNGTNKLTWHNLQFQGGSGKEQADTNFRFHDAWHCVGFFTTPILSGIFVVGLMIAITFVGVVWMMDIHSNDRFEDPDRDPMKTNSED